MKNHLINKSQSDKIRNNKFLFPHGKITGRDWIYYLGILPLLVLYVVWWALGSAFFEYEPENAKFQKASIGVIILSWTIVLVIYLIGF
jgi:hypothetical protein